MRFKFVYENVLQHKRRIEEVAKRNHALALQAVDHAKSELLDLFMSIDRSRDRIKELELKGGESIPQVQQYHDFILGQGFRIERQRTKIRELMVKEEEMQQELMIAAKDYKTFEKLKERELAAFKVRVKKLEVKQNDEMVTMRFKQEEQK